MNPRLKRCPFCGHKAKFGEVPYPHPDHGGEFIECTNPRCGCSTCLMVPAMDEVKTQLAEKWNNRHPQP